MKKKKLFIFFNIIIPLSLGLVIYLFCYETTYITTCFEAVFEYTLPYFYSDSIIYQILTCWACDILWAYSLTFSLFLCLKNFNHALLLSSALSAILSLTIEILQIPHIVNGTFNVLDIIFELTAIIVAVILLKRSFKK